MFFILSKLLLYLVFPATWIGFGFLTALIIKNPKYKQRCLAAALSLLLLFSNPFLLNMFARYWDIEKKPDERKYSCAIILGGFVSEDQNGGGFFNAASDRFIQALKLRISGKADNLLISGGNASLRPSGFRDASWLSTELKQFDIPDSTILIENASRNTLENAKYSKELLRSRNLSPPYLLVTSAFHMRRSLRTFRKAGLQVVPYPCNYIAGRDRISFDSFVPNVSTLSTWNLYIKEVVGYWVYSLKS